MKKWMVTIGMLAAVTALTACRAREGSLNAASPEIEITTTAAVPDGERPTEAAVPMEMVVVYRSNDGNFERVNLNTEELTEQYLIDKLIEYGVLDEGTEVLSFETEGGDAEMPASPLMQGSAGAELSIKTGTLDLSQIPAWSAEEEQMMLNCIGNTFVDNFGLNRLKLLVNGENYSGAGITLGDDDYLEYESGYKNVFE